MAQAWIGKWDNQLAVRLPLEVVQLAQLCDGEPLQIEAEGDTIIIRRVEPVVTLEDLFRGRTPEEWRAVYAGAYDWSPDVGREAAAE